MNGPLGLAFSPESEDENDNEDGDGPMAQGVSAEPELGSFVRVDIPYDSAG
jgi:hypothetical protein